MWLESWLVLWLVVGQSALLLIILAWVGEIHARIREWHKLLEVMDEHESEDEDSRVA